MTGPLRIAFFGAHPDDCEVFSGGLARAFVEAGARVTFVIATDGALSEGAPAKPALAQRRAREAEAGAALLGAALSLLGFPDGFLAMAEGALAAVERELVRLAPDLVVTHHPACYHRDHREISRLVRARIDPNQKCLFMEPLYGVSAQPNALLDISPHWPRKADAIAAHASQNPAAMLPRIETWNAFRAVQLGGRATHAEGYVIPADAWANPLPLLMSAGAVRAL